MLRNSAFAIAATALLAGCGSSSSTTINQCAKGSALPMLAGSKFVSDPNVAVGIGAVAAADLNADGKEDLVIATADGNTLSVLLGSGNGAYQAPAEYMLGHYSPTSYAMNIQITDVDNNGTPDVLVGDLSVSVFLNNAGTLTYANNISVGSGFVSVVAGKFDQDSNVDFMVATNSGLTCAVTFYKGDGTGGFSGGSAITVNGFATGCTVLAGQFASDANLDLVVTTTPYTTGITTSYLLTGIGDGNMQTPRNTNADILASADVNGDGLGDAVAANGNTASLLLANGNSFGTPSTLYSNTFNVTSAAFVDLNKDGHLDVLLDTNAFVALMGGAGATFGSAVVTSTAPVFGMLADVTNDGFPDYVVGGAYDFVAAYIGHGDGTFAAPIDYGNGSSNTQFTTVAVADFNQDGNEDVVAGDLYSRTLDVMYGNGKALSNGNTLGLGEAPLAIYAGDLNGDGFADLVVGVASSNTNDLVAAVYPGSKHGFLLGKATSLPDMPSGLLGADFNGDGHTDLLVSSQQGLSISVLLGNGDGTFAAPARYPAPATATGSIGVGDINNDGTPDIVMANGNNVYVALNYGGASFGVPTAYPQTNRVSVLTVGDINGDKRADVLTTDTLDANVRLFMGQSDGSLGTPTLVAVSPYANVATSRSGYTSLLVTDVNSDKKMDLVATGGNSGTTAVLLGNGTGGFSSTAWYVGSVTVPVLSDLNRDGAPDLVGVLGLGGSELETVLSACAP